MLLSFRCHPTICRKNSSLRCTILLLQIKIFETIAENNRPSTLSWRRRSVMKPLVKGLTRDISAKRKKSICGIWLVMMKKLLSENNSYLQSNAQQISIFFKNYSISRMGFINTKVCCKKLVFVAHLCCNSCRNFDSKSDFKARSFCTQL